MALPEQIKKQSEAITKFYEDANADEAQQTAAAAGDDASQSEEANGADASAPEAARNEQSRPATTADDTAEQRYRTLQGMYNADTARLRAEKQELTSRVDQLEKLLSSLSASQPAQSTQTNDKLITQKDIDEYGDSIDVMRRVTKEETSFWQKRVADLEQTIRDLKLSVVPRVEQVAQSQARSAEQAFWSDLTAAVPNWRDINQNKDFHAWLLEVDPLTGVNRQHHLENAQKNWDVRRVAAFFSTWQGNSGQSIAHEPRDAAKSQLEKQVAPGRGRTAAAPTADQAKTYSAQDITKFFNDVRKGVFKGRETERDRIERDIFAAQREGRIVATG